MAGQSTLEQAKTVLSTSRILSQATKVRLRYKRVDFLGAANRIAVADMLAVQTSSSMQNTWSRDHGH